MENKKYNIEELEKFLQENAIPIIKANPKTFLGIAKQPHYENVLSNIYAFYFNPSEEHGLNDLFIKSFVELIDEKTKQNFDSFIDFEVFTEVTTKKSGRIDLLLQNEEKAIIIENKVNHYLNNDLDDYWHSTKPNIKRAVVLSLKKIDQILPIDDSNKITYPNPYPFINITHIEFLDEVMKNSGNYLLNASDKYIIYLKDLYQNIINLSNQMETKNIQFYYKHQKELNDIAKLKFAVRDHIKQEVNKACQLLDKDLSLYDVRGNNEKRLRYYISKKYHRLMFTVVFEELLTQDMKLYLIVELEQEALNDRDRYRGIKFTEDEENVLRDEFYTVNTNWAHFASIGINVEPSNIENLSQFIVDKLQESRLISIFDKLETFLISN